MTDISKCKNEICVKREQCYRFTAQNSNVMQWYGEFEPNRNLSYDFYCRYFIGNKKFEQNNNKKQL